MNLQGSAGIYNKGFTLIYTLSHHKYKYEVMYTRTTFEGCYNTERENGKVPSMRKKHSNYFPNHGEYLDVFVQKISYIVKCIITRFSGAVPQDSF
jgi:hypothetical protein